MIDFAWSFTIKSKTKTNQVIVILCFDKLGD
jgi:hypothetical protein